MPDVLLKFVSRSYTIMVLMLLFLFVGSHSLAQSNTNAISYQVTLELGYYDPLYYWQTDADTAAIFMEVDLYYDHDNCKTVSRIMKQPEDFQLPTLQLQYETKSAEEFLIDEANRIIFNIKNTWASFKPTGSKKTILGYKCRGYTFTDFQGVKVFVYVASKLPANISPWGNVDLKGTVLEMYTSNGYHYVATDMGSGQTPAGFFNLPPWPIKTISIPAGD
jgi:GLPGLI family protein